MCTAPVVLNQTLHTRKDVVYAGRNKRNNHGFLLEWRRSLLKRKNILNLVLYYQHIPKLSNISVEQLTPFNGLDEENSTISSNA